MDASGGASFVAVATGSLLLQMGRLDEAAAHAELGLKGSPAMANSLLAQIALARDRPAEAEKAARAALASPRLADRAADDAGPGAPEAGAARRGAWDYADQAADEVARTGAAGQSYAGLHWVRGDLLARLGRDGEAEREFLPGDPRLPDDTRAYASLARALCFRRAAAQEAVGTLRRMVDGDGSPARLRRGGEDPAHPRRPQGAAALLRHALAVHPESKELRALAG